MWSGTGREGADPPIRPVLRAGEHAHIFLAALGASGYTFAYATPRESMADWLGGMARALTIFGGVTQLIVPDNPKAMLADANRYEHRALLAAPRLWRAAEANFK
jgi:transposase